MRSSRKKVRWVSRIAQMNDVSRGRVPGDSHFLMDNRRELSLDTCAQCRRHVDAPQLRLHREQDALLECVLRRTGGARLEMHAHARGFTGRELAIEVLVHATKNL